jgi:long-chain acyl-CoA synthetase
LEVHGLSNLSNLKGPGIFIANHTSYLDQPAIMSALPREIRYKIASATREEFFFSEEGTSFIKKILFPFAMIAGNVFLLPQKSGFRESLSFMGSLIDNGVSILIFPEGTRTRNGKLQEFMSGLGLMVKEFQVPVVPVRIFGMEKIYPRGAKVPRKGKCRVIFGKPIEFTTQIPNEIVEISRKAISGLTLN